MPIKFRCAACRHVLSIGTRKAGTSIQCPKCQAEGIVPLASDPSLEACSQRQDFESSTELPALHEADREPAADAAGRRGFGLFWAAALLTVAAGGGGAYLYFASSQPGQEPPQQVVVSEPSALQPEVAEYFKRYGKLPEIVDGQFRLPPDFHRDPPKKAETQKEEPKKEEPRPEPVKVEPEEKLPETKEIFPEVPRETEEEIYRKALALGREALGTQNWDQALAWFQIAAKIRPSDEALTGVMQAELGRQQWLGAEAARRKKEEAQKRIADYQRLMVKGRARLFLEDFDIALEAFQGALNLFPSDVAARDYLEKTRQAKSRWEEAERLAKALSKETKQQLAELRRKQEAAAFRKAMEEGKTAYANRHYRGAMAAFYEARELRPEDEDALLGWLMARKGLLDEIAQQEKEEQEYYRQLLELKRKRTLQEKAVEYDKFMRLGDKALRGGNFGDAILFFAQALEMRPGDAEARKLRQKAEQARDDFVVAEEARQRKRLAELAQQQKEAEARALLLQQEQLTLRKKQEAQQRAAEFQGWLANGRLALAQGKFDEALAFFRKTSDGMPGNQEAQGLLEEAQKARQARLDAEAQARKLAEEIKQAKDEALKRHALKEQQALQARLDQEDKQRQAKTSQGLILEAQAALAAGQFDLARTRAQAAVDLDGRNDVAKDLLRKAKDGVGQKEKMEAALREKIQEDLEAKAKEAKRRQEMLAKAEKERQDKEEKERQDKTYLKLVNDGIALQAKGDYRNALKIFEQAQGQRPSDGQLPALIKRARKGLQDEAEAKLVEEKKQQLADKRWKEKVDLARKEKEVRDAAKERDKKIKDAYAAGQEAVSRGKYQEAMWAFSKVLELDPDNRAAKTAYQKAEKDRDSQAAAANVAQAQAQQNLEVDTQREHEKRKAADYDKYMGFARHAMDRKLWEAAIGSFLQALEARPGDAEAQAGLDQARTARQQQLAAANKLIEDKEKKLLQASAQEAAANKAIAAALEAARQKAKLLQEQREQGLAKILATVRAAIELKRFDAAEAALASALKLAPGDPTVTSMTKYLEVARKVADKADADARQQAAEAELAKLTPVDPRQQQEIREAKVELHVDEGEKLLRAGSVAEAAREFESALRLNPTHQGATVGLKRSKGQ